ncbi:hypothetical protein J3R82DRAFT_8567 [Butyriboletus roseoflavus]|nr:hypothetical protein J3R82DRAFT_8567 [Butyriboletus roseoflavus]
MALTTEVFIFQTSDIFRNDPRLATPAFDIVLKVDGAHAPAYYGKQIENPSTGYVFLNWDSFEAHKALMDSPSYAALLESLKPLLGGPKVDMYHVQFSAPTIAFEKPVTEVLILTLKAPENRATVVEVLSKISEASGKILVFGQTREDENKYILVGGWPTVEAHWETAAKPEMAAALDTLYSLANKDHLYHAKLSQHRL